MGTTTAARRWHSAMVAVSGMAAAGRISSRCSIRSFMCRCRRSSSPSASRLLPLDPGGREREERGAHRFRQNPIFPLLEIGSSPYPRLPLPVFETAGIWARSLSIKEKVSSLVFLFGPSSSNPMRVGCGHSWRSLPRLIAPWMIVADLGVPVCWFRLQISRGDQKGEIIGSVQSTN
jgi:hypothetical protein